MLKKVAPFLLIILISAPLLIPLFQSGFFKTDDGGWMVIRLSAFHETLKTGQFPVRFLERLNHGYGYPVLNFLYPLPFYLGEVMHLLGLGFIASVKALFGLSFLLGAAFTYLWAKKRGKLSGVVAATLYTYFPYRITDIFQRGSLGESAAFIFVPLIFYFIDRKNLPLTALFLAALICSHNSLAVMFLPIIFLYKPQLKVFILALGLSTFFWLPALFDLQYTKALTIQVATYADYLTLNWPIILEIIIPTTLSLILLKKKAFFWSAVTLLALFFTLPPSSFLWEALPLPRLVQFPWRFFAVPALSLAVLGGMLTQKNKYLGIVMAGAFVFMGLMTLKVERTFEPDSYYSTNDDTTTVKNEYMPKWVKVDPTKRPVLPYQLVGQKLQINQVYFPGQTVYVDGQAVPINYQTDGFLLISPPDSQANIKVRYNQTPLHIVANLITLLSVASLTALVFIEFRHKSYNK